MRENSGRRDYCKCVWAPHERGPVLLKSIGVVLLFSYFFFQSVWAILPMSVTGVLFFIIEVRKKIDADREELVMQFRECMLSVVTSMKAGYAVENAFLESMEDMRLLYGEASFIYRELELIRRGMVINITLEELLQDLAVRSNSKEIKEFAEVFSIAKLSSGNLAGIMEASARLIGRQMDAKAEIRTLLLAKQTEMNVMKAMPFGIMVYIGITYPGYFNALYHNGMGVILMSGCLLVYLVAYALGEHMLKRIGEELL